MTKLAGGILITAKEIQLITGCHIRTAQIEHRTIRDALGHKGRSLTVRQYCVYKELDLDEVIELLNQYR